MDTEILNYNLPESHIAQTPADKRDHSKLLVVDRKTQKISHHVFSELPDLLTPGTRLFRNNAAVLQARLNGYRESGGKVECLLLRPGKTPWQWWCLLRPGKKASGGYFGIENVFRAHVIEKKISPDGSGEYLVDFEISNGGNVLTLAEQIGHLPLPPYIVHARPQGVDFSKLDDERYQTVYAERKKPVAAAAPTAGLHFSEELLKKLNERRFKSYDLTLHIGLGTFQPIQAKNIEEHHIHSEFYTIPEETRKEIEKIDVENSPRLAVGTTSLRAMEDFSRREKNHDPMFSTPGTIAANAELYIYPPNTIISAEQMITNFHLPKSTLMCLVASFLTPGKMDGIQWLKDIYAEAIKENYRFYSYGDAMFIR